MTARLHYFERVDSTMDLLHQLAAEGAAEGTAVIAGEQLEGRGSRGRSWHSPPGGLWLSMLFRPAGCAVEVMSLRVGLAVAEALDDLVPHPVQLKWPNDLMLGERKVGGILCEARWQGHTLGWVAVGVGMNVRNAVPQELTEVATALASERAGAHARGRGATHCIRAPEARPRSRPPHPFRAGAIRPARLVERSRHPRACCRASRGAAGGRSAPGTPRAGGRDPTPERLG